MWVWVWEGMCVCAQTIQGFQQVIEWAVAWPMGTHAGQVGSGRHCDEDKTLLGYRLHICQYVHTFCRCSCTRFSYKCLALFDQLDRVTVLHCCSQYSLTATCMAALHSCHSHPSEATTPKVFSLMYTSLELHLAWVCTNLHGKKGKTKSVCSV